MSAANIIIPGAPKAGTMSIASILNEHPDIYVPVRKEPRFFIEDKIRALRNDVPLKKFLMESSVLDWEKYQAIYNNDRKFKIDASVQYMYYYETAGPKIKKYLGDPYVFIILRDPVQRAMSNYFFNKGAEIKMSSGFIDAIQQEIAGKREHLFGFQHNYKQGLYYEQVKYYLENFSNVKVLFYEDFQADNLRFINSILDTLGVPAFESIPKLPNLNTSSELTLIGKILFGKYSPYRVVDRHIFSLFVDRGILRKRKLTHMAKFSKKKARTNPLTEDELKYMYDLYEEDVLKLIDLLNLEKLPWPRFKNLTRIEK